MIRVGMAMVALLLAACSGQAPSSSQDKMAATRDDAPVDDAKVECALGGSGEWTRECVIERVGKMLIVRHPDGGFRRFHVLDDGRGLDTADGSEAAKLSILDDKRIEVGVGADRYRLLARIDGAGHRLAGRP